MMGTLPRGQIIGGTILFSFALGMVFRILYLVRCLKKKQFDENIGRTSQFAIRGCRALYITTPAKSFSLGIRPPLAKSQYPRPPRFSESIDCEP